MRRTAVGARQGTGTWLLQRASAVVMVVLLPFITGYLLWHGAGDYAAWRALFAPLAVKVAVLLGVAAMLLHAWIGLREILIDYVHALAIRLPLYLAIAVFYLACLMWAADILWRFAP